MTNRVCDASLNELADPCAPQAPSPEDVIAARLLRVRLLVARHILATRPWELVPGIVAPPLGALLGAGPLQPAVALEQRRIAAALAAPTIPSTNEDLLVDELGLTGAELDALWLLAAPELSPRALTLIDDVLGFHTEGVLPAGFVRHIVAVDGAPFRVLGGALERHGLVEGAGLRAVRITPRALALLEGAAPVGLPEGLTMHRAAPPPSVPSIADAAALARQHRGRAVVVGPDGSGARTLAHTLAGGAPVLEVDLATVTRAGASGIADVVREIRLAGAALIVRAQGTLAALARAQRTDLTDALAASSRGIVIDAGSELDAATWGLAAALGARRIALAPLPPAERRSLWTLALSAAIAGGPELEALAGTVAPIRAGVDDIIDAVALVAASGPVTREALASALDALSAPRDAAPLGVPDRLDGLALRLT